MIKGHNIELVSDFQGLGSWLYNEIACDEEVKTSIDMAHRAFNLKQHKHDSYQFDVTYNI